MIKFKSIARSAAAAAFAALFAVSEVLAGQPMLPKPETPELVILVGGDCYAIGQQIAEQNGGQLAKAQADNRGGQDVCVIVVLVPGKDGQRPRRSEFVVPN
jgi:hypothetical protein